MVPNPSARRLRIMLCYVAYEHFLVRIILCLRNEFGLRMNFVVIIYYFILLCV